MPELMHLRRKHTDNMTPRWGTRALRVTAYALVPRHLGQIICRTCCAKKSISRGLSIRSSLSSPPSENKRLSFFQNSCFDHRRPVSNEGRVATVTDVERGMRRAYRFAAWFCHADEQCDAHVEVVWAWRAGADAKLGDDARASRKATGARPPVAGVSAYKP